MMYRRLMKRPVMAMANRNEIVEVVCPSVTNFDDVMNLNPAAFATDASIWKFDSALSMVAEIHLMKSGGIEVDASALVIQ